MAVATAEPYRAGSAKQLFVDDRRLVYTVDRFVGGLYILEMTL